MKKNTIIIMTIMAILSMAICSCGDKDEIPTNNGVNEIPAGWVDLGLPSGLLWAECNLGADTPEMFGNYYAWGETNKKEYYSWGTYKYCKNSDSHQLTKYCNNSGYGYNGFTDTLSTLEAMDDAATAALGNGVRIPTKAEWNELIANCSNTWTTQNGVNGWLFTSTNGNTLFLPAAGSRLNGSLSRAGSWGSYWSATLGGDGPYNAQSFHFDSDWERMTGYSRYFGFSVRAVRQR